ncbi:MAG: porin [Chromatiales bacterium]|nr:porin [Chromatiales bacterium]
MNKKVLAIAVAAALAAPAAALADTQIYGVAHVSLDFVDSGDNSSHQLSSNSSRLGFKGSEDLGNGLKAIWQIESGADLTGGGGQLATRNSFVGLAGGWGTAVMGRHDTPYKMSTGKIDVFGDKIGDYNTVIGYIGGVTTGFRVLDNRAPRAIAYLSPNMGGLSFALAYVTDLADDMPSATANDKNAYSANVSYSAGPLYLTMAYESLNEMGAGGDDVTGMKVGASYSFGDFTIGGVFENADDGANDRNAFYLGGKFKMGATYLAAAFGQADELTTEDGATMYAIGVGHNFSKRTEMYAVYAAVDNDDMGNYRLGNGGFGKAVTAAGGETASGLSFGIVHKF